MVIDGILLVVGGGLAFDLFHRIFSKNEVRELNTNQEESINRALQFGYAMGVEDFSKRKVDQSEHMAMKLRSRFDLYLSNEEEYIKELEKKSN